MNYNDARCKFTDALTTIRPEPKGHDNIDEQQAYLDSLMTEAALLASSMDQHGDAAVQVFREAYKDLGEDLPPSQLSQ